MSDENAVGNSPPLDTQHAAEQYLRAGLSVIPVPAGEKNPNRGGWQDERWSIEEVPKLWDNGQGIGVLWGEPSSGLVDVDLDWREARIAADYILPTTRTFGRPSAPESHRVYRGLGQVPKPKKYKLPGDGPQRCVVEVLSTGNQSLVPPSLHDCGERRVWYQECSAAEIESGVLMEGVADVATAALLARNWPGKGARHDYVLAAAGYIGRNLPRARVERIMEAAIAASGDEEANGRSRDVRDTLEKVAADIPTTGGPTLDELAPGVVDQLQRWHRRSIKRNGEYGHRPISSQASGAAAFNLTDLGNAQRLVARHGDDLRYCHPWRKWLAWDGMRWAVDATGEVERRAVETVASIYTEATNADGKDERKTIARHAQRSEARRAIDAMIALARSRSGIPIMPEDLDADPWLLNVENGTIDLRSGELREHRREDLISKLAPVEYDPDAEAATFQRFLERTLPQEAVRSFLQRAVGYAATGVIREEVLPILHGPGANGKTTLTGVLMDALGDYAIQAAPDLLMLKKGAHPTELADLYGARFVVCMENEEGRRLAESLVKYITGRERIKARRMREDFWEFAPTHTVFLGTNHRPEVRGTDHAIWRRLKLVPFDVTIPEAEQDKTLPETLRSELPGVLAWIVQGCIEYQRVGLGEPDKVRDATKIYRTDMDPLEAFIDEECIVKPEIWCKFADLYASYTRWCEESNEYQINKRRFADRLTERGFEKDVGAQNTKIRRGIALRYGGGPDPSRVTDPDPEAGDSGPDSTPEDGMIGNPVTDHSTSVTPQNTWKTEDSGERVTDGYRESYINTPHAWREGLYRKVGNIGNFGNSDPQEPEASTGTSEVVTSGSKPNERAPSVSGLFANPPSWLPAQLAVYGENPEKHIKPLCSAVAAVVLGDGLRADEVREEVERELQQREEV